MGEIRGWSVRSNSFRPDYVIRGETLAEAIRGEFRRICQDALPRGGRWRPVRARAEWMPGILRGRGGVEMVIVAEPAAGGASAEFPVWIAAAPADMREPLALLPASAA